MSDRIDEWRVFTAVATRRSFSGAARALRRSPQHVTRAVAALAGGVDTAAVRSPAYLERAGTPRSLDALAQHECIDFAGTAWAFARRARPRLTVTTSQAAIDAAVAGFGIARVLSYQIDR